MQRPFGLRNVMLLFSHTRAFATVASLLSFFLSFFFLSPHSLFLFPFFLLLSKTSLLHLFTVPIEMASRDDGRLSPAASESSYQSDREVEEIEEVEADTALEVVRELGGGWGALLDQEIHAYWRPLPSYDWGIDNAPTELPKYERPSCFYFFWLPVLVVLGAVALHLYVSRDKIDWSK